MRIALRDPSNDLHWLAGEASVAQSVHTWAEELRINGEIAVQWLEPVRATAATPIDRGNLRNTVTFSTTRKFLTPRGAQLWCADHDATIPRRGTLVLEAVAPDGATGRRELAGAIVLPPERELTGCTLRLRYTVLGRTFSVPEFYTPAPGDTWEEAVGTWEAGGG